MLTHYMMQPQTYASCISTLYWKFLVFLEPFHLYHKDFKTLTSFTAESTWNWPVHVYLVIFVFFLISCWVQIFYSNGLMLLVVWFDRMRTVDAYFAWLVWCTIFGSWYSCISTPESKAMTSFIFNLYSSHNYLDRDSENRGIYYSYLERTEKEPKKESETRQSKKRYWQKYMTGTIYTLFTELNVCMICMINKKRGEWRLEGNYQGCKMNTVNQCSQISNCQEPYKVVSILPHCYNCHLNKINKKYIWVCFLCQLINQDSVFIAGKNVSPKFSKSYYSVRLKKTFVVISGRQQMVLSISSQLCNIHLYTFNA